MFLNEPFPGTPKHVHTSFAQIFEDSTGKVNIKCRQNVTQKIDPVYKKRDGWDALGHNTVVGAQYRDLGNSGKIHNNHTHNIARS